MIDEDPKSNDLNGWRNETSGSFSVRSAYDLATEHPNSPEVAEWNAIWKLKTPSRIKMFLWLARYEKIMTNSLRMERSLASCDRCWRCTQAIKDIDHVLCKCSATDEVWSKFLPQFHLKSNNLPFRSWLDYGIANKRNGQRPENENSLFAVTIW